MRGVLTGFAVIAAVIAVGYLLGRRELLGHDAAQVLARVVFFVAAPALLFETLARADVRTVVWAMLLVTVVSTTAVIAVFAAVARMWWRRSVSEITVGALASSYVNAANLGIPIAVYVLGDASYVAAVLLFQLLVMAPVAFAVLDTAAAPDRRSLLKVVSRPLRNPVTVASGLGLACSVAGWLPPEPVLRPVELIGGMAVPAALIAYGVSLHGAERPASGDGGRDTWLVVVLKNLVQPAVAYLFARYALQLDGVLLLACTVTAALPTAQNVFVYAVRYDRATVVARDAVLLTTVAAAPVLVGVAALAA